MISFPEDLTLFFGVRTPEQEAKGRKDVFPRVAFGSEKFHWGEKKGSWRREVQKRLLNLVPLIYPERPERFGAFFGIQF